MSDLEDLITFVWWNTSLSHGGKSLLDDKSKGAVWRSLEYFTANMRVDFIALTEVSESAINDIEGFCNLNGYKVVPACDKVGRTKYDFCLVYKKSNIEVIKVEQLSKIINGQTNKVGVRIDLSPMNGDQLFHVIISHWTSRLYGGGKEREFSAQELRCHIDSKIIAEYKVNCKGAPYILLMGDYNDDPFDKSLSQWIMGSRDINLVKRSGYLFYNPFWTELGAKNSEYVAGSYYYKGGKVTQWHTFDQMLYSHAFMGANEWEIVYGLCKILPLPDILSLVTNNSSKLDHLPIIGAVKRKK